MLQLELIIGLLLVYQLLLQPFTLTCKLLYCCL